jgi:hypothetical protein
MMQAIKPIKIKFCGMEESVNCVKAPNIRENNITVIIR